MYQVVLQPLEETLARLGPLGLGLSLVVPPGRPTVPAGELIRSERRLRDALERFAATIEADEEVAASQFSKHWANSVSRTALAAYAAERRVPDVAADNSAVIFDGTGRPTGLQLVAPRFAALSGDPGSADSTAVAVPDEARLRAWLRDRMFDGHLNGMVDALAAVAPIEKQRLWGNVAAACASAFSLLSSRHRPCDDLAADAEALLDAADAPTRGLVHLVPFRYGGEPRLFVQRETCCLRHRLSEAPAPCLSCPLLHEPERRRRLILRLRRAEA